MKRTSRYHGILMSTIIKTETFISNGVNLAERNYILSLHYHLKLLYVFRSSSLQYIIYQEKRRHPQFSFRLSNPRSHA